MGIRSTVVAWFARLASLMILPACASADCLFADGFDGLIPSPSPGVSAQIAMVRAALDGATDLPVDGAVVTYVKPTIGADAGGFFVQGDRPGPAVFVAVGANTLNPVPQAGDVVSFRVTQMATAGSLRQATAVSNWSVAHNGARLQCLLQEVSTAGDLVSAVAEYESELVAVDATVAGAFQASGSQFVSAPIATTGIPSDNNLRLRVTTSLQAALQLDSGCSVSVLGTPLWRSGVQAQVSAWDAADISVTGCGPPTVASAVALNSTSVRVDFSRPIDATSVSPDGSQFVFDSGLQATAATASGTAVTVTTSSQTGGTVYTVTVAPSVHDTLGNGVPLQNNSASFTGYLPTAELVINEVNANIANGCDLIELRVLGGGTMSGIQVRERTASVLTFTNFTVQKNDFIVVHFNSSSLTCNPLGAVNETTSTNQQPAATYPGNYDTAFDWYTTDAGLTNTTNVITLYRLDSSIMDAVFLWDSTSATAADTDAQAAIVNQANQWQPSGGGATFQMGAVQDLNATGTSAAGVSIQRVTDADTNTKADWGMASSTFGALNPGESTLP